MTALSILIPTTPDRSPFIIKLKQQFKEQLGAVILQESIPFEEGHSSYLMKDYYKDVEVVYYWDQKQATIGRKRNFLKSVAQSKYLTYIDSDDRIGPNYFKHAFAGIEKDVDACGLTGIITEDGQNPKKFVHSMKYDSWYEKDGVYYRNNNHLNVVKTSIARQMKFPEINSGEDHDYSKQLLASGLIKTEYWDENEILYYYDYVSKK